MPRRNATIRTCKVCKRTRRLRYTNTCKTCRYILNADDREDPRRWLTTTATR